MAAVTFQNPSSGSGVTNNTTAVTVVAAPANCALVRMINVYNADTVSATGYLQIVDGGVTRKLEQFVLAAAATYRFGLADQVIVLTSTQSLQVVLSVNVTTTQLNWYAAYSLYA